MAVMRKQFATLFWKALIAAASLSAALTLAMWASARAEQPAALHPLLASLQTFEIAQFHEPYGLQSHHVPPEILMQAQTALRHEPALRADSPAQGVLTLSCDGHQCPRILAELRQGADVNAPVLWQTRVSAYSLYAFDRFWSVEKPSWKVARQIVRRLAQDVTRARQQASHQP